MILKTPRIAARSFGVNLSFAIIACLAMTFASSSATAQDLLGYWALEEIDFDADVLETSGNPDNGPTGLLSFFNGGVEPDVEGAPGFGSGAHFDGATGQVEIDDFDNQGVFGNLTNDFTVMAWIKPEQFDHKGRIMGVLPVDGGWGFGTNGDSLEITTFGVRDYTQPVPLELDTWTHVAVALDSDNAAHFYANGEFVGTQTHGTPGNATTGTFFIGAACCGTEYFEGVIDEVAVFSGALNENQVKNAMSLAVKSFDAPPINPDGLRFQLDFGISTTNGSVEVGVPEGWDSINDILAEDTCDYLGNAETPCTIFALTDQEGTDNDVTLEILEVPFITNATPADTIAPYVFGGAAFPQAAIGDYQYRDPDTADSSAPFRFSNLDPGTYEVTVAEGRSNDGNGQFAKLWVGDADGSNEPGVAGEHEGENTGDFAGGAATLTLDVGEGEFLWYRHLEDNSGGISAITIRSLGSDSVCDPNSAGDLDGNGTVDFTDFLVLSGNFGNAVADHTAGDIDCSGEVDFSDFLALSANFGTTVAAESVPEPNGMSLAALAFLAFGHTLRRRR